MFDALAKVREAGNQDEKVVKAFEATNQCLKEEGFENVDANLLFSWQKVATPSRPTGQRRGLYRIWKRNCGRPC